MPTLEHNAIVEMFRENPELAPHLLALLFHIDVPPHASVEVVESSLDQLVPVEFRADLVLELRDASGVLVLAIVLEVQRDKDPDREYSWPVYVTVLRAKKRCQSMGKTARLVHSATTVRPMLRSPRLGAILLSPSSPQRR